MKTIVFAAAFAALATAATAQSPSGEPSSPQQASPQQKVSPASRQFVQKAAITDLFEIQAGQMAQQKAADAAYKEFGQKIATNHQATSEQLKSLAENVGIQPPTGLDAAHKKMIDTLQPLPSARFEAQFKTDQVQGHRRAIKLYDDYAKSGDQPELKEFAQQTLPKLQEHLKDAQALPRPTAPTVGSGGRASRQRME